MVLSQQSSAGLDLIALFGRGGFVMWPLLFCSLLAMAGILDRGFFFLFRLRYRLSTVLDHIQSAVGAEVPAKALGDGDDPPTRLARLYLENLDATTEHRRNVIQRQAGHDLHRAEQRVGMLSAIAALSPLIGLLGTVWGMVEAFATIETLEQVKPADVAGGIWSALLTTVFGLCVAIPAVAATRWAEGRIETLARDLNLIVSHLDDWTGRVTQR